MIKNVVFDMGNVLIMFDPEKTLSKYLTDENDIRLVIEKFYNSELYRDTDRGVKSMPEVIELLRGELPGELCDLLDRLYVKQSFGRCEMPLAEGMEALVAELNENGYGTYLLSNAGYDFYDYSKAVPAIGLMKGAVVSCDRHFIKPEREIYEELFEKFSLAPSECIFIDDMQRNIDGAKAVGMDGICYSSFSDGVAVLRRKLKNKGINIKECI